MEIFIKLLNNLNYKRISIGFVLSLYCILNLINVTICASKNRISLRADKLHEEANIKQNRPTTVGLEQLVVVDEVPSNHSTHKNLQGGPESSTSETKGVWCYCNLPECVPHGYMCQSISGRGCFSKRSTEVASSRAYVGSNDFYQHFVTDTLTRGCFELLSYTERRYCEEGSQTSQRSKLSNGASDSASDGRAEGALQCCSQDMCNYEMAKPIIIREIDESDVTLARKGGWFRGVTIAVSVMGVVVLIFLFVFAGRILASEDKGRSSEFLNERASRDLYIKVPYYIERTPSSIPAGGEGCSILCVKALQKKQDVADYCRFHPLSATSNRHSLSCPSSLASFPPSTTAEEEDSREEELLPLTENGGKWSDNPGVPKDPTDEGSESLCRPGGANSVES